MTHDTPLDTRFVQSTWDVLWKEIGTPVPKGGSMCKNCHFVSEDLGSCHQHAFQRWNGGKAALPGRADEYCCSFWQLDEAWGR